MKSNNIILSVVFVLTLCSGSSSMLRQVRGLNCPFSFDVTVFVYSKLPANSPPLRLHCASGDNELGWHMLRSGDDLHWPFCSAPRTLFFCHLWWGKRQKAFDVYKAKFSDYDHVYNWEAHEDGIYLYTDHTQRDLVKKYDWEW